ncbi:MAG TPA: winged helix-turn-helix domain-containing protein [Pyrinomonadaceae bacterium]|nr:winged helix-turn-helix domain-containing protein [Pyrinomonadaceae bacterium]
MLKTVNRSESAREQAPATPGENIPLFADFVLDLARGCLHRGGERVHLRPQSYEVLKILVENKGRLISKDRLIEEVWQGRAVTDDALVQCLMEVRHALGPEGKLYVRNVRGRGYIFDLDVVANGKTLSTKSEESCGVTYSDDGDRASRANRESNPPKAVVDDFAEFEEHPVVVSLGDTVTVNKGPAVDARRAISATEKYKPVAMVSLAVVVGIVLGIFIYSSRSANPSAPITSIVVLPFANASGDQNLEYVSDGLSESLIDRLSQLPGMKVIARSSSFKYKGREADPQEVGRALGVQALVTGRVVQRGEDLDVRAELIDASGGTQLWGERYRRRAGDIQMVQEEIARTISARLQLRLSGAQQQQLTKHFTENSQAYQFYLNGLFLLRQGGVDNVRKALDYYNQAVVLDPNFALAWVGVADANSLFAGNSWRDPKEANAKSKAAAETALALDEAVAEAHVALGRIKMGEWDWAGAEREYKRAIELNPNLVEAHRWYASYLSKMERHTEALAEIKRAQELDPLSVPLIRAEGFVLNLARRYPEALEKYQQANRIEESASPGPHYGLGFIYEGNQMYQQAIDEHRKAIAIEGETTSGQCYVGYALASAGRRREAMDIVKSLKSTKEYVSPTEFAGLYALLGDHEQAFALLEKAYAERDLQLQHLKIDSHLDPLRSDPRFQDLVRRVGLRQ